MSMLFGENLTAPRETKALLGHFGVVVVRLAPSLSLARSAPIFLFLSDASIANGNGRRDDGGRTGDAPSFPDLYFFIPPSSSY